MQSRTISTGSVSGIGNAFAQSIPPYSLTTVVMTPSSTSPLVLSPPPAPILTPSASAGPVTVTSVPTPSATATATTAAPLKIAIGEGSVATPSLAPGGATTFGATVTATARLRGAVVDFYIYDATGKLVDQTWRSRVTLAAGAQNVSAGWTVPATLAPGAYTLKVAVFRAGWSLLYAWDSAATTFTVS